MMNLSVLDDLRIGLRSLKSAPGFAFTVAFVLALGIGANVALFTVINALVLRLLPYERTADLVEISQSRHGLNPAELNQAKAFQGVGAFVARNFAVMGSDGAKYVFGFRASANLFSVLGVHAALGRVFEPADEHRPVAMMSYDYWRQTSGDPQILGQTITVDNEQRTVVGILPPEFSLQVRDGGLFIPYALPDGRAVGRLNQGVTLAQATAELASIQMAKGARIDVDDRITVRPIVETFRPGDSRGYLFLQGAVGLVLLILCLNVANLVLIRSAARRKEFAIRAAIGAGRLRLMRQLLIESAMLAVAGGAGGLLIANWSISALNTYLPLGTRRLLRGVEGLSIDRSVLAFAFGISLLTVMLFGLAPAIRTVRFDVMSALRSGITPDRRRYGQMLVTGEVALSLMLLIAGGLTLKSLIGLEGRNLGFSTDHVLRAAVEFSKPEQPGRMSQALGRLSALPGVETVGLIAPQFFPFGGPGVRGSIFEIQGRPGLEPRAEQYIANPDYFHAVRIPLLKGRLFTAADTLDTPSVALISEIVSRRYWGQRDPLGESIRLSAGGPWITIVGVVGDVRNPIGLDFQPTLYRPLEQSPVASAVLMIRTAADPLALSGAVIKDLHTLDPGGPPPRIASLEKAVAEYINPQRFSTSLLGLFALLGLLLAALGIYGVIHYWVSGRISEIGVRVALGAQRTDIFGLVLAKSAVTAVTGIGLGVLGALALQRWLASQLYGVSATDPEVFLGVSLLMSIVAFSATLLPARRAMAIDPVDALRHD